MAENNLQEERQKLELMLLRCEVAKKLMEIDTSIGKIFSIKWVNENVLNIQTDNKQVL